MQERFAKRELVGAVTLVVTKNPFLPREANGFADVASHWPLRTDIVL